VLGPDLMDPREYEKIRQYTHEKERQAQAAAEPVAETAES
jgi:hypothetical protein